MSNNENLPYNNSAEELFEHFRIVVDKGQAMLRIDKFLTEKMQNATRNKLQVALDSGSILVNEKPVKPNYKVKPEDIITIVLPYPHREMELLCEDIPLDIVYEDNELIVVNKRPGMVVHPAYGNYTGTLINALAGHFYPELVGQALKTDTFRPGLPHRIDKNTSGLVVIAKTEDALNNLSMQFYERTINRHYIALAWGDFKEDNGTVTGHVGRNLSDRKIMDVFPDGSHGKNAITHYKVLEKFGYVTLIQCKLETGRTHQIRVHMQHIGHPLFGDFEYGGNKILRGTTSGKYRAFVENNFVILPRQALHAQSLGFVHPATNEPLYFEAILPDDIQTVLERWRNYTSMTHRNTDDLDGSE